MGVAKSRITRSRRGMRRSHDKVKVPKIMKDPTTGQYGISHNMVFSKVEGGFYRGKEYIKPKISDSKAESDTAE